MNRISNSHKFTSLLLLVIIVSHLFVFHFELEEKILCIGDGEHFHIENILDSHSENSTNSKIVTKKGSFKENYNCTDYLLDNHIDEDFAKIKRTVVYRFVQIINLNKDKLTKSISSKNIFYNRYIKQKYITEQLPTILLLI
jgi:hypothetical protein